MTGDTARRDRIQTWINSSRWSDNMAQRVLVAAGIFLAELWNDPQIVALHHQREGART